MTRLFILAAAVALAIACAGTLIIAAAHS